jgi:hypothetical protein
MDRLPCRPRLGDTGGAKPLAPISPNGRGQRRHAAATRRSGDLVAAGTCGWRHVEESVLFVMSNLLGVLEDCIYRIIDVSVRLVA